MECYECCNPRGTDWVDEEMEVCVCLEGWSGWYCEAYCGEGEWDYDTTACTCNEGEGAKANDCIDEPCECVPQDQEEGDNLYPEDY